MDGHAIGTHLNQVLVFDGTIWAICHQCSHLAIKGSIRMMAELATKFRTIPWHIPVIMFTNCSLHCHSACHGSLFSQQSSASTCNESGKHNTIWQTLSARNRMSEAYTCSCILWCMMQKRVPSMNPATFQMGIMMVGRILCSGISFSKVPRWTFSCSSICWQMNKNSWRTP